MNQTAKRKILSLKRLQMMFRYRSRKNVEGKQQCIKGCPSTNSLQMALVKGRTKGCSVAQDWGTVTHLDFGS